MSRDNVKKVKPSQDLACKCIAAITDAVAEKFGITNVLVILSVFPIFASYFVKYLKED